MLTPSNIRLTLASTLTLLHLLVDGICACSLMLMAHRLGFLSVFTLLTIYNILAFATQPFTGMWLDRSPNTPNALLLAMGLLLTGSGLCMSGLGADGVILPIMSAVLLGLGNSLYHVIGGKYVAVEWHNDIRPLGIYVSTGAVGLTIGLLFSSSGLLIALTILLVICSGIYLKLFRPLTLSTETPAFPTKLSKHHLLTAFVLCVMFVVAGRSFIGNVIPPLGIKSLAIILVMSAVTMVSKAAGGFLSMNIGLRLTLIGSLLLSCICFLLCSKSALFIPVTAFLISLSMPCTLYLANEALSGREGLAFGLLAAALLPGFYIAMAFNADAFLLHLLTPLLATIIIESLVLILMRQRQWTVLWACVLMNIITNPPLNIFVHLIHPTWIGIIALELLVILIESLLYMVAGVSMRKAITYSLMCNLTSYLLGVAYQLIF